MANIAIFERLYDPQNGGSEQTSDPLALALAEGGHKVVCHERTIRQGALALTDMRSGDTPLPDMFVLGNRLDDDRDYFGDPVRLTSKNVPVPALTFGGVKYTKYRDVTTQLLPLPNRSGAITLPNDLASSPENPRHFPETGPLMHTRLMLPGRAGYVLSHLIRLLLPRYPVEQLVLLTSSRDRYDIPVGTVVYRGKTAEEVQEATVGLRGLLAQASRAPLPT